MMSIPACRDHEEQQELQKQETAHKSLQKSFPCQQSPHWVPRPESSLLILFTGFIIYFILFFHFFNLFLFFLISTFEK